VHSDRQRIITERELASAMVTITNVEARRARKSRRRSERDQR
jgi:hypothetical protein